MKDEKKFNFMYQDFNASLRNFGGDLQSLEERGLLGPQSCSLFRDHYWAWGNSSCPGRGPHL